MTLVQKHRLTPVNHGHSTLRVRHGECIWSAEHTQQPRLSPLYHFTVMSSHAWHKTNLKGINHATNIRVTPKFLVLKLLTLHHKKVLYNILTVCIGYEMPSWR